MAGWTGKKTNVVFFRENEPSFLKKFKERVGYKDDAGVSLKFQEMPKATAEDLEDADDERPQVVQLKPGDLSQDDYEKLVSEEPQKSADGNGDKGLTVVGRILFRKPSSSKRPSDEVPSKKKKVKADKEVHHLQKRNRITLLSFNADEDEEED